MPQPFNLNAGVLYLALGRYIDQQSLDEKKAGYTFDSGMLRSVKELRAEIMLQTRGDPNAYAITIHAQPLP